ncbi:hydroxymethylbilane synthase [Chloroflexota bacterium]
MKNSIVIGSRGSKLAIIQAGSIVAQIKEIRPDCKVSIRKVVTQGDRDRHTQLDRIGVAVFVKELEQSLLDGRIDLAVHSLKDVPTEMPQDLHLLAVTQRLDPRDALVAKSKLSELAPGSRIGTGSFRRTVQLTHFRPDLEVCSIRGNVDTRVYKVYSGEVDGIIVAAAAMLRLGWEDRITEYLPLQYFLPAVGQGALVAEARLNDKEMVELVSPINHLPTWQSIMAERAFLRAMGGVCRAPIAAFGTVNNSTLKLEGMIASPNGRRMLRASEEGSTASPEEVGAWLAEKMLAMGASGFIAEVRNR